MTRTFLIAERNRLNAGIATAIADITEVEPVEELAEAQTLIATIKAQLEALVTATATAVEPVEELVEAQALIASLKAQLEALVASPED